MNYLTDKILRGTHRLYVNHYGSYLKPIDSIMDPEGVQHYISTTKIRFTFNGCSIWKYRNIMRK